MLLYEPNGQSLSTPQTTMIILNLILFNFFEGKAIQLYGSFQSSPYIVGSTAVIPAKSVIECGGLCNLRRGECTVLKYSPAGCTVAKDPSQNISVADLRDFAQATDEVMLGRGGLIYEGKTMHCKIFL